MKTFTTRIDHEIDRLVFTARAGRRQALHIAHPHPRGRLEATYDGKTTGAKEPGLGTSQPSPFSLAPGSIETRRANRNLRDRSGGTAHAKQLKDPAIRRPVRAGSGRDEHCLLRHRDPMDPIRSLTATKPSRYGPIGTMPGVETIERGDPEHTLRIEFEIANQGKRRALSNIVAPPRHPRLVPDRNVPVRALGQRAGQRAATADRFNLPPTFVQRGCCLHDRPRDAGSDRQENKRKHQSQPRSDGANSTSSADRRITRSIEGSAVVSGTRHAEPFRKLHADFRKVTTRRETRPRGIQPVTVNQRVRGGGARTAA